MKLIDFHIHPRPNNSYEDMKEYTLNCIEKGIEQIGFLEHGPRISPKRKGRLTTIENCNSFIERVDRLKMEFENIIGIYSGVELDFSTELKFVKWNEDLIFNSNFDFITGSVHGKYTKDYQIYIQSNIEMAKNWPVDIIGHLHIPQNYAEWTDYYRDLFGICVENNKLIEINTRVDRVWTEDIINFIVEMASEYPDLRFITGSDAHKSSAVGDGIAQFFANDYELSVSIPEMGEE